MQGNVRVHAIISGRVQGVFYRLETQNAANRIGVNGWVRNLPDGTVEAVFEGEKGRVKDIIAWCQKGPRNARVDQVKVDYQDYAGEFGDFKVTY